VKLTEESEDDEAYFEDPRKDLINIWTLLRASMRLAQAVGGSDHEWGTVEHKEGLQKALRVRHFFGLLLLIIA